jgi:hypothetical protein
VIKDANLSRQDGQALEERAMLGRTERTLQNQRILSRRDLHAVSEPQLLELSFQLLFRGKQLRRKSRCGRAWGRWRSY